MRTILLLAMAAAIAAPAAARRAAPGLPLPSRGVGYVETLCTGGFAGIYEQVRVLSNGQIQKAARFVNLPVLTARASRVELRRIWRALDIARFESRTAPPEKPYIADGIDCSLTRRAGGGTHTLLLLQQMRDKPRYRDLAQVIADINALGRRATGPILRPAAS